MSRSHIPASIEGALPASQVMLQDVKKRLGVVPNLFRLVSQSPSALEGYLGLMGALGKGELPAQTRERIALAVGQVNGCQYCLSAHTYLATNVARLDAAEIAANRRGQSQDTQANAAVGFATKVARERGRVGEEDLRTVREAGYTDAQILEIIQHVALNVWTNYVNNVFDTDIDFPKVEV